MTSVRTDLRATRVPLAETGFFGSLLLDYLYQRPAARALGGLPPALSSFPAQWGEKQATFTSDRRATLQAALRHQYQHVWISGATRQNLDALDDPQTFTVSTGHQLGIFGGPMYFVYKIATTVKLAQRLATAYPQCRFVPVFWMATEDHDLDEIRSFHVGGKTYTWNTEQTGAVGRMHLEGLGRLLADLPGLPSRLAGIYRSQPTLAAATRALVNELFGAHGIVVVDGDDADLKRQFADVVRADLFEQRPLQLAMRTAEKMAEADYEAQVHVRPVNFFYLEDHARERIERDEDGNFRVVNTSLIFTPDEIERLLAEHPERFSPNVVLRPLYQEWILPNLAYVGGPAEVAYWLQLKSIFSYFDVPYPVVLPRNFALLANRPALRHLSKVDLSLKDALRPERALVDEYLQLRSDTAYRLDGERQQLGELFAQLTERAVAADPTLEKFVGAREREVHKVFDKIQRRLRRADEARHADALRHIRTARELLFPAGKLQERHANLLNFYPERPHLMSELIDTFDPFDFSFYLLAEDDED